MDSCTPVLQISHLGLTTISNWVTTVHSSRLSHLADSVILFVLPGYIAAKTREDRRKSRQEDRVRELKKVRDEVARVLERFRVDTRCVTIVSNHFGDVKIFMLWSGIRCWDPIELPSRTPAQHTTMTSIEMTKKRPIENEIGKYRPIDISSTAMCINITWYKCAPSLLTWYVGLRRVLFAPT